MPLLWIEPLPRRVSKGELLRWVAEAGGLEGKRVGRIELTGNRGTLEVPDGWETRLVKALDGQRFGERRVRVWTSDGTAVTPSLEDHFQRLARLLEVEAGAESRQAAERARRFAGAQAEKTGNSMVDLIITDEDTGLGGRFLVQLIKRSRSPLPWTRLDTGSPVVLTPEASRGHAGYRGVVYQRDERSLRIALTCEPEDLSSHDTWRLDLSSDEVAVQRQRAALERARTATGERLAQLRAVLLGQRPPQFANADQAIDPEEAVDEPGQSPRDHPGSPRFHGVRSGAVPFFHSLGLNAAQRAAVRFALGARDVALIHGPPGTGKTRTVVELICQAADRGAKILACAPSNLAVDNLFERLLAAGRRAVRLGHPARVLPELRRHTLDLLVDEHPDVRLARKLVKDAWALFRRAERFTRARPVLGARQEMRQEARSLLADARRMEAQAVDQILDRAEVLCATTTGLDSELLGPRRFDLAVIDEASQSTEPGCWIPLLRAERVVLAGDHCQLPPTVVSDQAAAEGFGVSLFERLMSLYGTAIARQLTVQYRMHQAIMDFPSRELYGGVLEADESVRQHRLCDLPALADNELTQSPLEFLDTAGAGFDEKVEADGESRANPQEAELVVRRVQALLAAGLSAGDLAVITPYAAQVRLLRSRLPIAGLEIDSVDGFQGREKEAVVISLVRSNPQGEIGFLRDIRRLNVALTRARRKLVVIGDSATLAAHPFYERMIDYFQNAGAYRTVWEEGLPGTPTGS